MDQSTSPAQPAVYLTERWSGSAFGSWFTSLGFSAPHPYARATWERSAGKAQVSVVSPAKGTILTASVDSADMLRSEAFESSDAFAAFISQGVSSYGLSRYPDRLTRVNLHKADHIYTPLMVDELDGPTIKEWTDAGAVLDSAFRTSGGRYEWTYHGLTNAQNPSSLAARETQSA